MTILIFDKDNDIYTVTAKGHANYGPYGTDIVCAGISTLMTTLAQLAVDDPGVKVECLKLNAGDAEIIINAAKSKTMEHKAAAILTGFKLLANEFPQNVNLLANGL